MPKPPDGDPSPAESGAGKVPDSKLETVDEIRAGKFERIPQRRPDAVVAQITWAGPLPSPHDLAGFERVLPGAAERIVSMTEREQEHRHKYESKGLDAAIADTRRGHYLGAGISAVAIGGAVGAALLGAPWPAVVALVGVPVAAMVEAIVTSLSSESASTPEPEKKPEQVSKSSRKKSRR